MSLVVALNGLQTNAAALRTWLNSQTYKLRLFQNNYTPLTTSVIGDFTEATFSGYAGQNIGSWAVAVLSGSKYILTAPALTFSHSGGATGNTIYGYYIVTGGIAVAQWAERDPNGPRSMTASGDTYIITPTFSLKSEF